MGSHPLLGEAPIAVVGILTSPRSAPSVRHHEARPRKRLESQRIGCVFCAPAFFTTDSDATEICICIYRTYPWLSSASPSDPPKKLMASSSSMSCGPSTTATTSRLVQKASPALKVVHEPNPGRIPNVVSFREPHPRAILGRSMLREYLRKLLLDQDEFMQLLKDC